MKFTKMTETKGTFHQLKGSFKEFTGKLTDNPKLRAEGTVEKIAGKLEEKIAQARKFLGK